ncbi:probable biphenyl-2,3-diol 1,2-dioxygenase III [Marinomonas sp. MED121]|uniref:VOC family protein n=1 Tax=Marinomonas sp. MED121 TaxID=314277 RepID=UPI0000691007|nr:VOC family protein [Marinomonas sp. MED121]EAQ67184.1 probable biphenyl-2,3-diol 1,2-dioxygenase III [Marinomonas sp. MED121]
MISHIDHLVLTVSDIDASVKFFEEVFSMTPITFANGRKAVSFGNQKINFQTAGQEMRNHALEGSGDLCLIASVSLEEVIEQLNQHNIEVLEGPVEKTGAMGPMMSVYINDLDNNLIEISRYPESETATQSD